MSNRPSAKALEVQNQSLREEVEHLRHFLKGGDSRLSLHLFVLHRADAWRHRHRAEAFADQLRDAGRIPVEPDIPPLPTPAEDDESSLSRWFAQIDEMKRRRTDEAKGTAA